MGEHHGPAVRVPAHPDRAMGMHLAVCAHKALPLALDKAASALGLTVEKDKEGNRLTLSMSRFDKKGYLPELTPEKRDRIAQYCDQDVRVERQIEQRVGRLGAHERKIWMYDQIINQRGVRLDMAFVRAALRVVERATGPLQREFADLTGGLGSGQVAKVLEWCRGQGVEVDNLQKGTITALLGTEEDDSDDAGYLEPCDDEVTVVSYWTPTRRRASRAYDPADAWVRERQEAPAYARLRRRRRPRPWAPPVPRRQHRALGRPTAPAAELPPRRRRTEEAGNPGASRRCDHVGGPGVRRGGPGLAGH
jgi:hypothetical protein